MASIERRLRELEEISGIVPEDPEDEERRIRQQALSRMTFEELGLLEKAVCRLEEGAELDDEDLQVLRRDDQLREEVRSELNPA